MSSFTLQCFMLYYNNNDFVCTVFKCQNKQLNYDLFAGQMVVGSQMTVQT